MDNNYPYKIEELSPQEKADVKKAFGREIDFISIGPKRYMFLRPFAEEAPNVYNMTIRPDDLFIVTYQRSGTTFSQELVWLLANDIDFSTAKTVPLRERYKFLEMFMWFSKEWQENYIKKSENKELALSVVKELGTPDRIKLLSVPSPRFIKTHIALSLLPPNLLDTAKVVYVARDPRDVAVSSYFHSNLFQVLACPNPFKDFWEVFRRDLFTEMPVFEHIKEAWALRHHPNMLFLFYEDMVKDLPTVICKVADFLGKEVTVEQMAQLCDHLSFENFKNNDMVNFEELRPTGVLAPKEIFIRKGKPGGWREYFDEEMTKQAQQWFEESLRDTDLRFPDV